MAGIGESISEGWLTSRNDSLASELVGIYASRPDIRWHGWTHVEFVAHKAGQFAVELDCGLYTIGLLQAAGLTHDTNYLVSVNSSPDAGSGLRADLLMDHGYEPVERLLIEEWVLAADTKTRRFNDLSDPAKALSDADTLYKALPFRPVLSAIDYMAENGLDPIAWADGVIAHQKPLLEEGSYFYTQAANKYLPWAWANLRFIEELRMMMDEPDTWNLLVQNHAGLTLPIPA